MSDYLSSLKKDFREYAFEGKKTSGIAKAIDDGTLTSEEYKSLKNECIGNKTGEEAQKAEKEFNAAMISTFGESVSYLNNSGSASTVIKIISLDDETVAVDNNNSLTDGVNKVIGKDDSAASTEKTKNNKKAIYLADSIIRATERIPPNYKEVFESLSDMREMKAKGEISPLILKKTEAGLKEAFVNLSNRESLPYKKEQMEAIGKLLRIEPPLLEKDSDTRIKLYRKLRDEKIPVIGISPVKEDATVDLSFKGKIFLSPGINGLIPMVYGSTLPPATGVSLAVPLPAHILNSDSITVGPIVNGKGMTGFGGSLTYGKVDVNISFHHTQAELNGTIPSGFFGGVSVVMPFPSY